MLTIHENASKGVYVESARVSFTSMEEFSTVNKITRFLIRLLNKG